MTEAYPLQWPIGKSRGGIPTSSRFGTRSLDTVTKMLLKEVRLLKGENVTISTNLRLRRDGLPYSEQRQPVDVGAAVYFSYKKNQMCFACDRWDKIQDNIYAIAMTIEALRGIERWGSGDMVQQAFTGFVALPAPPKEDCYDILRVHSWATEQTIIDQYKKLAKFFHPDCAAGSVEKFQKLTAARDEALRRLSA